MFAEFTVNSPARPTSQKKPEVAQLHREKLFEFATLPFLYDKKNKQWKELAEGKTEFLFEKDSSSIVIRQGDLLCHKLSVSTAVQKQVRLSSMGLDIPHDVIYDSI
jgi:hypothetical protein